MINIQISWERGWLIPDFVQIGFQSLQNVMIRDIRGLNKGLRTLRKGDEKDLKYTI